ncbi:cyclic nucleotide-binding domain-containing protein [bacterium]|nr:MAG: cyclic nucleotide-binding domain-containing protein [bacterium]
MIDCDKLEILRRVPVFAAWLDSGDTTCLEHLSRGEEVRLKSGEWLCHEGDPAAFYLVLEGELRVMKKVGKANNAEMLLTTHKPGVFFGEIPLMTDNVFVAGGQAAGNVVAYRLDAPAFWALFASCPGIAREVTRTMAMRMQHLESLSQTREKLISLGTLAAGLAHELNNPAAATKRAASQLRGAMREVEMCAIAMHGLGFEPSQCSLLKSMREAAYDHAENRPADKISAMQRADMEDELADWLDDHEVKDGYKLAPTFVASGVNLKSFELLSEQVTCKALGAVVEWLEASLRADGLALEIERASNSISHLVGAVKSYSHLDEAPQQRINIHEGIDSTLTMLKYKLRGIEVKTDYDCDIPEFMAHGSELNQVWTNILDNAADALKTGDDAKKGAQISIATHHDSNNVLIKIRDNGPGIPADIQKRIFEPFFTTKGVGSGTGLGLDIAHRIIVGRHGGDIKVESGSTGTQFCIRLPLG